MNCRPASRILLQSFLLCVFLIWAVLPCSGDSNQTEWRHWKLSGPWGGNIQALVPDRNQPGVWFAINNATLYRSSDGANSWTRLIGGATSVSVNPKTSEALATAWDWSGRGEVYSISRNGRSVRRILKGPYLEHIQWAPDGSSRVYATGWTEFFASLNGGRSWRSMHTFPEGEGHFWLEMGEFVVPPFDVKTIYLSLMYDTDYCCDYCENHVSYDGGHSWQKMKNLLGFANSWDPSAPDRLFAYYKGSTAHLTPSGWEYYSPFFPIDEVAFDPSNPNHMYGFNRGYYGEQGTVLETSDSGRTWTPIETVSSMAQVPLAVTSNGSLLLSRQDAGLFKRMQPHHWQPVNQGFQPPEIPRISKSPKGRTVYALTGNTVFRFDEQKHSWRSSMTGALRERYRQIDNIVADPRMGNHVLASTHDGFMYSKNGGRTWRPSVSHWGGREDEFLFDPKDDNRVYAWEYSTLFVSDDGGGSFSVLYGFWTDDYPDIQRILTDPVDANVLYAVTSSGVYKSTNRGSGFQYLSKPKNMELLDGALLGAPNALLVIDREMNVYRTSDGLHWEQTGRLPGHQWIHGFRLFPADNAGTTFYAIYDDYWSWPEQNYFLQSTDGGVIWTDARGDLSSRTIIYDMTDPRFHPVYLATSRGVLSEK